MRGAATTKLHARSLAPVVKARRFGMTQRHKAGGDDPHARSLALLVKARRLRDEGAKYGGAMHRRPLSCICGWLVEVKP